MNARETRGVMIVVGAALLFLSLSLCMRYCRRAAIVEKALATQPPPPGATLPSDSLPSDSLRTDSRKPPEETRKKRHSQKKKSRKEAATPAKGVRKRADRPDTLSFSY